MVFNSFVFIQFAIVFFGLWQIVRPIESIRHVFLIVASCLFYAYGGWWFVPLLLGTATVDFYMAKQIYDKPERKKFWLIVSLVSNLSVLGIFKYSGFFAESMNAVLGAAGAGQPLPVMHLILPIGISFYTFQSLSYIFDVYRGQLEPAKKLTHFLSIVTLFPHLVAGPIVRVRHILPQIEDLKKPSPTMVWDGLQLVAYGLFKKAVLADNLSPVVDSVFRDPDASGLARLVGSLAFAFQIYYDFSGYTDIARGLAKWVGVEFTLNFDHPYTSIGIRDFWSRWHMSLSYWIRDYVYIPLGGSRLGELKAHRNIWVAMVVSGLWHGANWTFVFWGALHAFYQSVERITNWPEKLGANVVGKLVGVLLTFAIVTFGWIFFRAESIGQAFSIIGSILNPGAYGHFGVRTNALFWMAFALSIGIETGNVFKRHVPVTWQEPLMARAALAGVFLAGCIFFRGPGQAFIYFQF